MQLVRLHGEIDFDGWRRAARRLVNRRVAPEHIEWRTNGHPSLLAFDIDDDDDDDAPRPGALRVPRGFLALAQRALLHSDPARFALLYRLLWRMSGEPGLMRVASDVDLMRARNMAQAVDREIHKTHAFVRFREVRTEDDAAYIAWFEPTHHTLEAAAPFFVKRFSTMRWSILTPRVSAHWNLSQLAFGKGASREEAAQADGLEALWRTYYASIFNPARLKTRTMQQHMPRKYWRNMPETALVSGLVAQAPLAQAQMLARAPTTPRLRAPQRPAPPVAERRPPPDIAALREQACRCTGCPLHAHATQTVFGEGPDRAALMFVGEQPGDQEDLAGRPFVGPAGNVFDRALQRLGLDRRAAYVTNAVKHFKFEPRGKRRLHKTPGQLEIDACRGWLEQEIALIQPRIIVALGGTAAHTVLGSPTAVQRVRGKLIRVADETQVLVTVHPSYLLRLPRVEQADAFEAFVADLAVARDALSQLSSAL